MIVFYFIFVIETQNLVNWVRSLKTKIGSRDFTHSLSQYVIALDNANDAFSFNIFWNVLVLCLSVIICVFRGANASKFKKVCKDDLNDNKIIVEEIFLIFYHFSPI